VALGGVAASAAHALSTPLSSAAITLEGLQEDAPLTDEQRNQVTQTLEQIQRGRSRLTEALRGAQLERLEAAASARPPAPRLPTVPVASQKPYGAGAGLLLAQANLERLGGALTVDTGAAGWRATLRLPLVDAHE
jgi:signal transduction histidine kinase